MQLKTILFDLDGTLLPLDQDFFIKKYFESLNLYLAKAGLDRESVGGAVIKGTFAMMENDGKCKNEELFWKVYEKTAGRKRASDEPLLEHFYTVEFQELRNFCGRDPEAKRTVDFLREKGFRLVLATNPVFPRYATESRVRWAGLSPDDFEYLTTYENSSYAKPKEGYYEEILHTLDIKPEECLMVGNDVVDDMVAKNVGMNVFLMTDCLLNREGRDVSEYPKGNWKDLRDFTEFF